MRALLLVAGALGGAGQAAEWSTYDASVAALCNVAEGATAGGAAPAELTDNNIVQTTGTKVRVTAPGNPDAVWVKDGYGMILTYSANANLPIELDFGTEALDVKLFVHYPSCHITSTNSSVQTWRQEYNDYVSSDAGTYSSDVTGDVAAAAKPVITTDYTATPKTATVTFTQPAGVAVPHAYAKDNSGLVLAFLQTWAAAPNVASSRSFSIEVPEGAMAVTACSLSCTTHELVAEKVSAIESGPMTLSAVDNLPISLSSADTLAVEPACAGAFALYAKPTAASSSVLAYGSDQGINVPVDGLDSVLLYQTCGSTLATMTVHLPPLRAAYASARNSTTLAPSTQNAALTCTMDGVTHSWNDVWSSGDQSCMCVQGVSQCGGGIERGIFFDNAGIVGVCLSAVIIATVLGGAAYHVHMQRKLQESELGRRKSFSGKNYYGSSAPGVGQQEVELPISHPHANVGVERSAV